MTKGDLGRLAVQLAAMADVYGAKRPTTDGMFVWAQTLQAIEIGVALEGCAIWARTFARMPMPAELLKLIQDHQRRSQGCSIPGNPRAVQDGAGSASPESGRRADAAMAAFKFASNPDPKAWAKTIHRRFVSGEMWTATCPISPVQITFACSALGLSLQSAKEMRAKAEC